MFLNTVHVGSIVQFHKDVAYNFKIDIGQAFVGFRGGQPVRDAFE